MPRIVVTTLTSNRNKKIIDEIEEISKKVFGKNGILPMEPGSVEIIPNFKDYIPQNGPTIEIIFYPEKERTPKLLNRIKEEFEKADENGFVVRVSAQPEELWRTI